MTVKRGVTAAVVLSAVVVLGGGAAAAAMPGRTTAAACAYPADVLDLHNWYEGLPIGDAENPKNVKQPELATYRADPWFTATPDCSGVQFRAAVNGVTTSGSSYPRSELRETDGSENASWSSTSGTHTMVVKEAITHLPEGKNQVVAGQIHGSDDDLTVFRLEGSKLYVTKGDDSHYKLITGDYRLGTVFEAKYVVSGGKVQAYYNGVLQASFSQKFSGAYFKAGAYTQANCDKSSPCSAGNYGEVVVHGLTVTHAAAARGEAATAWPGSASVRTADDANAFGENLSGLSFGSPDVLWAVKNGPGTLYRLVPDGPKWTPAADWALHYGDGSGDADAEGVVATPDGIFAATERDNDDKDKSKQEILRFDPGAGSGALDATGQWDLTPDLPKSDPNTGIEAISWVPDSFLTAHGFTDQKTGKAYDPASYPGHGSGLYFAGLESNGTVYAYALDLNGRGYTRVASFKTGFPAVMDLEFEPETGHLWAACDDTCKGQTATLDIRQGAFAVSAVYNRPNGMANYNNEGFAIAPQCAGGRKAVLWSDDGNDDDHALRSGDLPCTAP
ncbi:hypothetical protein Amsp01_092390 [Amycolatopsis sp. NBRC 101858]|uniref:polysaccharide lyase family 7 protein n=1 Tax=Amycolatopsis sp. NBRC 101858 TaxID=3032200 RepID=UPI0024A4532E|nr:polysaccharide lyase family 7 protein [Amycolatopsis sp. NBRC 101858]GLY43216.1 hypothetical protein Amsp01_092390 [Amycolatopsis sp. NBRC 101858]